MSETAGEVQASLTEAQLAARDALWAGLCQSDPQCVDVLLRAACAANDEQAVRRLLQSSLASALSPQELERLLLGSLSSGRLGLARALAEQPGVSAQGLGAALKTGFILNDQRLLESCAQSLARQGSLALPVLKAAHDEYLEIAAKSLCWDDADNAKAREGLEGAFQRFEALLMSHHLSPASPGKSKPWGL